MCFDRLKKRNRSEEVGVPFEYLKTLHKKHEEWLLNKKEIAPFLLDVPVLVLDCDKDFEFDIKEQEKHLNAIAAFFDVQFKKPKQNDLQVNI